MIETAIIEKHGVGRLKDPVMVTGLPGIGLVGQVVAKYMIKKLGGKKMADLYSPHFPHQVLMTKKGGMRLLKNKFYLIRLKKRDLIIVVGDVQAITGDGQYEVAGKILDYAQKHKVREIITIGGYSSGKMSGEKKVFAAANSEKVMKRHKDEFVFGETKGSIVGVAGLLPALALIRGIDAMCVMGETHGSYVDPSSAKAVLEKLAKLFSFKIDMEQLEQEAKEREKMIKKIEGEIEKQAAGGNKDITYIR
ncbi:MAG TPA: proteasome assembly chaperone family protein [Candidatus Bilamarchaeaceae archaeon]|nr:proteasome assembly chaperone family protein [Candidatus Bilamarchaeaceae archaeon]